MKKVSLLISIVLIFAFAQTASASNLVSNGSFENPVVTGSWQGFPGDATGVEWTVSWASGAGGIPPFELHKEGFLAPVLDGQYTELDSTGSVSISQGIETCDGGEYQLTYYWYPRTASDIIDVMWGDELLATHTDGSWSPGDWNMETHTINGNGGVINLSFTETANSNGLGMFLDEVVVTETSCPDIIAPAMPTGLDRYAPDEDARYACGDVSVIQRMHPDWEDNTEADFSHYEYKSFNPEGGGSTRTFTDSIFPYSGGWSPGVGTYGYAVRAVDLAGNASDWALTGDTLEGSCQITYVYDTTGAIIEPVADEIVSGLTDLIATYDDGNNVDDDAVNWAVRPYSPNCSGGGNLFGGGPQVSGIMYPSTFTFDGKDFNATIDTTLIDDGKYCFVFNPTDDPGENNVRELVGFHVFNSVAPDQTTGMDIVVDGDSLGCYPYISDRGITVDWDDSTATDLDYYQYQADADTVAPFDFTTTVAQSERSGQIRDEDGTYNYRVRAVSTAGLMGEWSDWCGVTLDREAPEITLIQPEGDIYDSVDPFVPFEATCSEDCTYVNFWWEKVDEPFVSADKQYHYVREIGTLFNWTLNIDFPEYWKDDVGAPLDDGEYKAYAAGKDRAGNWARTELGAFIIDRDGDGLYGDADMCEGTITDIPTEELGTNRWALVDFIWETVLPGSKKENKGKAKGPDFTPTIEGTNGCSCTQILEWLNSYDEGLYGDMLGHYKFGCSKSALEDFMTLSSQ